jgi:lysophospholipase L1-like esterase
MLQRVPEERDMARLMMVAVAIVCATAEWMSAQAPVDPNRWESTIQKFEAEDQQKGHVKGGIVFIGSSSIARWTNLAEAFPHVKVVNRGFGGSELSESVKYARRVVVPHAPRVVVLYAGENDLNRGLTPASVAADFGNFTNIIRTSLPTARIIVIGLKPSLLRWKLRDAMHQTNALLRARCSADADCVYVDPWPSMIGADGTPKPEFFVEDGLHMTPAGYHAWTDMLRPHLK